MNYLRDIMAVGVGGTPDILKIANPTSHENLKAIADAWGVQTILSAIQILDESLVRMRASVSATTLGYGDTLLSEKWKLLSGFIAANGLILFSLNTAFLFEALRRFDDERPR